MKNKKRLVILDNHAILHRAYHALPNFSSSSGEPTGGLFGLSSMLISIIRDLKPDYIAAAFDMAAPTYRHEVFEGYKGKRSKAEDELVAQIVRSYDIYKALNIPVYEREGFEADDVIGTIVEQLKKNKDIEIYIASGDMDTVQLVDNKRVQVYTLRKGVSDTVTYDEEAVKERYGFASDLLPDFKGLAGDPSDNIPGVAGIGVKTATTLIQECGTIENIYKTIKKKSEEELKEKHGIKPRTIKLLKENEEEALFSKMLATIRKDVPITYSLPKGDWTEELNMEKVVTLFRELEFRTLTQRVQGLLGDSEKNEELISDEELEELKIGIWIINSNLTNPTKEDILHFTNTTSFAEARKKMMHELSERNLLEIFNDIERPLIPIIKRMKERGVLIDLNKLSELSSAYHAKLSILERDIYKAAGEEFNINSPKQLGELFFEKLHLSTKGIKKTSGGQYSTAESELEKLRGQHEIVDHIFEYRALQKLLSTYIDNLPKLVKKDGRLHAEFLQYGTTTGRMSSQNPNLQNIPIKTEEGRAIREAFIATKDFELVALDYSQVELRVAALLSGDQLLIDVFKNNRDVHTEVASRVFGVERDDVDKEMRRKAKVINFGILYGMGVNALKQNLGSTQEEARTYLDEYFEKFPQLAEYIEKVKREAARNGYTETLFGRRRYFQGLNSHVPYIRAAAERMAVNAPIQGTSADIIKKAMIEIDRYIEKEKLHDNVYLLLQVHDELIFEIHKDMVDNVIPRIQGYMEGVLSEKGFDIPLIVDVLRGSNWGNLE